VRRDNENVEHEVQSPDMLIRLILVVRNAACKDAG
jgi:hypothetical protein